MPELSFVASIATGLYALQPQAIESLAPHPLDWRAIYCLQDTNGHQWVLRLFRQPDGSELLTREALLLDWLAQQGYPMPQVRWTTSRQLVGILEGWSTLLLSFVDGEVLGTSVPDLALLGQTVGRLHALPVATAPTLAPSRCHPERIRTRTLQQLVAGSQTVPISFRPLVAALCAAMTDIHDAPFMPIQITHGDCWYRNAIKTRVDTVVLIDWDAAGMGLPLLDLGYLLLAAHFDLAQPLVIEPDADKVNAILSGYQQHYRVESWQQGLLVSALRFPLAFHLGNYLEQQTSIQSDDSFLQKVQRRFEATEQIAHLAVSYLR
jgi:Ser/Thr protein kinase RdoA (MazF antagonist)